jgi:3-phenylpropionate/trans-cinnamate dioxygenase ferredoxin reductase subunit
VEPSSTFVIVGASLAGATAAVTLRTEGFDGRIVLIGEEPHPPYERPPLSKEYFRGEQPFEDSLVRPLDFDASNDIETHFGTRATRVDPLGRTVHLSNAKPVRYDKVLIATGSRNRRLPIPGLELEWVYDLRTVDDCDRIRAEIVPGRRGAVVGMGFIGSEIASSLRQLGVEVVAVDGEKAPLYRALGGEVGQAMEHIHRDHGVKMIFEDHVAAFEGVGGVERIVTRSGRKIDCDFAVVGVGVEPVIDVVAGSGVQVENGIVVDEYCRTNVDEIFAAGDVTNHYHPIFKQRMRVEHWHNALNQGPAAARNMMGKASAYDQIHWFWSDQYDYNLQYAGFHRDWDDFVVRGSLEKRDFIAFYVKDGGVTAAVGMNRGKDVHRAMELIKTRAPVETKQLSNEDFDLRQTGHVSDGQRREV